MIYFFDLTQENYLYIFDKNLELKEKKTFSFEEKFKDTKKSYISLPLSKLNFRIIEVPFSDEKKIREIIPFELSNLILSDVNNIVFDFVILGKNEKCKIFVSYIEKDVLKEILGKFKSIGIDVFLITCLELKKALQNFSADNFLNLKIKDEERVNLAKEEIKNPTINLLKGEFTYTKNIEKIKKSFKITVILVVLALIFLLSSWTLSVFELRNEISTINNDMSKTYSTLFPKEKIVSPGYQLKAHLKEAKEKEKIFIGLNSLHILLKLSKDSRSIKLSEIFMDKDQIILKGESKSMKDIQNEKERLKRDFSDVDISDVKNISGKFRFTIIIREKE